MEPQISPEFPKNQKAFLIFPDDWANPELNQAGPPDLLSSLQNRSAGPQNPPAGHQTPLAGPYTPLVDSHTPPADEVSSENKAGYTA